MSAGTIIVFATHVLASPLRGEACFRLEQKSAKARKQGEGERNRCMVSPSPNFTNARSSH